MNGVEVQMSAMMIAISRPEVSRQWIAVEAQLTKKVRQDPERWHQHQAEQGSSN